MEVLMDGWMEVVMDGSCNGWMDGWMEVVMNGSCNGWMDGWKF